MTIDTTATSPVFEALLLANPWARDHWSDRLEMISAGTWNINAVNQAGNAQTREWLDRFTAHRVAETHARILGQAEHDDRWTRAIRDIVTPIFNDPMLAGTWPGTPLLPVKNGIGMVRRSGHVAGYAPGQFLADVLLLAQPSLRDCRLEKTVDISGRVFPIGPDFSGAQFGEGLAANNTTFGPFTEMSTARFGDTSFQNATFYGSTSWTLCQFQSSASFAEAHFHGSAGFDAARFAGVADFSRARFGDSAQFAGTVFASGCHLDDVYFADSTTFEYSQFAEAPSLEGIVFIGTVSTVGVSKAARQAIAAVSRPGPSIYPD